MCETLSVGLEKTKMFEIRDNVFLNCYSIRAKFFKWSMLARASIGSFVFYIIRIFYNTCRNNGYNLFANAKKYIINNVVIKFVPSKFSIFMIHILHMHSINK